VVVVEALDVVLIENLVKQIKVVLVVVVQSLVLVETVVKVS
jgi:hypothetical protein